MSQKKVRGSIGPMARCRSWRDKARYLAGSLSFSLSAAAALALARLHRPCPRYVPFRDEDDGAFCHWGRLRIWEGIPSSSSGPSSGHPCAARRETRQDVRTHPTSPLSARCGASLGLGQDTTTCSQVRVVSLLGRGALCKVSVGCRAHGIHTLRQAKGQLDGAHDVLPTHVRLRPCRKRLRAIRT